MYASGPNPTGGSDALGWSYDPVDFSGSPDLFPVKAGQSNIVEIPMQGGRTRDFTQAFKEAGIHPNEAGGYTCHHVRDLDPATGKTTMQLVRRSAHEVSYPHAGSVEQYEKAFKVKYDTPEAIRVSESKGWLKGRPPKGSAPSAGGC